MERGPLRDIVNAGTPSCPLCAGRRTSPLASAGGRNYLRCADCRLAFMEAAQRPAPEQEHAHYRLHQNNPADAGYRRFLSKLLDPLLPRLRPGAQGLDFGSGPGPAISIMLGEAGFDVQNFDPFFAPDPGVLDRTYDFITCTETIEHFHRPGEEFVLLDALLRPSGCLAVMSEMLEHEAGFADWWYRRDPTHVCFYSPETMQWIAARRGWQRVSPRSNVTFFLKPAAGQPG
jgi:hypothetical protein